MLAKALSGKLAQSRTSNFYQEDPDWDFLTGMILAIFGAVFVIIVIWMFCHKPTSRETPKDLRSIAWQEHNAKRFNR